MTTPLIGITTYERNAQDDFVLPAVYIDAVRRAGGIPVLLPPGDPHLSELLMRLDGVILSGGADVDPTLYGGAQHPKVEPPNPERDESEIALVQRVVSEHVPTLAICRGAQVVNVALGGTLIEHLPDEVNGTIAHRTESGTPASHPVTIVNGSCLHALLGGVVTTPASWHHQAIRKLAPGIVAVAHADDGTIEAIEMLDHPWLIGVQWHPEITAGHDSVQQRLFDAFVVACAEHMRK